MRGARGLPVAGMVLWAVCLAPPARAAGSPGGGDGEHGAAEGVEVTIRVTDQVTGDPIEGARVRVGGWGGGEDPRTGPDGRVRLSGPIPPDARAIYPLVQAEGYAVTQVEVTLPPGGGAAVADVSLEPLVARVRGRVRAARDLLDGVEIVYESEGRMLDDRHMSGDVIPRLDGSFELRVPAGAPCRVIVRSGWRRVLRRVDVDGGKPLEPFRRLVSGDRIGGRIYELPEAIELPDPREAIILDDRVFEVLDDSRPYKDGKKDLANGEWFPCDLPVQVRHRRSGIVMRLVPAGRFRMGASPGDDGAQDDEKPAHEVTITRPFYLGKYEVTWEEWERNRGSLPIPDRPESATDDRMPVVNVSWEDCKSYCDRLGLRLPAEAEWEYAARAGVASRYPWGGDPDRGAGWANVRDQSWKRDHSELGEDNLSFDDGFSKSAPAGSFRPNALGLYDMIGNVWEWCQDWYDPLLYTRCRGGVRDPSGPSSGRWRVLRGGSWDSVPRFTRLSNRGRNVPTYRFGNLGFRVASDP